MNTLYNIIVDAAFKGDMVSALERVKMYRLLEHLRSHGVALAPALDFDEQKPEDRIPAIRKRFENAVSDAFGISAQEVLSTRKRTLLEIYRRRACYAVLVVEFGLTTGMIAKYFDTWHDRTTIIQSFSKHFDEVKFNREYYKVYSAIIANIKS